MIKACFLDRDGVINVDKNYVYKIEDFEFNDGIFELLEFLKEKGYVFIVVTNQSGIARGLYTKEDFSKLSNFMTEELKKRGIDILKIYHCPHHPDENCECRKPRPKMILDAKEEFDIDLENSIMIGDRKTDIQAANNAKIGTSIFIGKQQEPLATISKRSVLELLKFFKNDRGELFGKKKV